LASHFELIFGKFEHLIVEPTEIKRRAMHGVLVQSTLNLYPLSGVQLNHETSDRLAIFINGLVMGHITFKQCADESYLLTGLQEPIERLNTILSVPDTPPSPESLDGDLVVRRKNRVWAPSEDDRLFAAIHRHGVDNWRVIAQFVGHNRTSGQCSQRWLRVLDPRLSHCEWTGLEEFRLIQLVRYYGPRSWTNIAAQMGNRSDVQCRYHYRRMLSDKPPRRDSGIKKAESGSLPFFKRMQYPPPPAHEITDRGLNLSQSVPVLSPANLPEPNRLDQPPPNPGEAEHQPESSFPELLFNWVEPLSEMEKESMKVANWY
jgi:hypothetical protein